MGNLVAAFWRRRGCRGWGQPRSGGWICMNVREWYKL